MNARRGSRRWLGAIGGGLLALLGYHADGQAQTPTIWFGAVSNLQAPRGFSTDPDYPQLFTNPDAWGGALSHIKVFKVVHHYIERAPEADVRRMFTFLRAHNIAVAAVFGMVTAEGCGRRVEGMAHGPRAVERQAERFRDLGADVRYIVADEPLTFGHYFSKGDACRFSIEQVAQSYAENIRLAKSVFPNAVVVDTEATTELNSPDELSQWFDLLRQQLGPAAPTRLHLDIQWDRDDWSEKVGWIINTAQAHGLSYGIIYHGTARDRSDGAWMGAVKSHIVDFERSVRQRPADVVLQSWNEFPSHVLPESDPTALTSLVDWYCTHSSVAPGCR